jgi:DNA polymerase III subunit epsilon
MPLRPIFYDFETTGTDIQNDRVIELAAFDPYLKKTFERFINPGRAIPQAATAIHHITDEMVKDAPTFEIVGPEFLKFCQGDIVLVAHNNDNFDYLFLLQETKRYQIDLPPWPKIDTLKWARKYRPDLPKHSLQFLRTIYGFADNGAHRALKDVDMLHQIFSCMIDDLSYETVLALLSEKEVVSPPSVMPFGKYKGKPLNTIPADYVKWLKAQGAFEKPENTSLKQALEKAKLL